MDLLGVLIDEETEEENIEEETPPYNNLQLLPGGSPLPDEMPEEAPICPRVGEEYQVEVSDSPVEPETVSAENRFLIGLPVPLTWVVDVPVPGTGTSHWSETEAKGLVLGLYVFGKNLRLVRQFIESKSMGDVLGYYYGVFYKSEAYKKWVDCRKARTRRCIVGARIFTGWRQQELVTRLLSVAPQEKHETVLEAIKSFNENTATFEDFIFSLRSTIGLQTFIDAVSIGGKGREDLTAPGPDLGRAAHPAPARPEIPSGKACSSLSPCEIIKFLTGDFRLSKARANDLFWEAVWPRLLARGWHSEQPRDLIGSKNSLVFLLPGIKKFSRKRLMKGEHYYDCVSDVLKKVAAEPGLLEIESFLAGNEENGEWGPPGSSNEYLKPKVRSRDDDSDFMRFMVVDTSMLHEGGGRIRVRELKSLPADVGLGIERAGLKVGPSGIAISSDSSDSECNNKSGGVRKRNSSPSVASNGHIETTTSVVNDVKGHFGNFSSSQGSKPRQHKYLSPVPKRRRLSGCKHQQGVSQKGAPFFKGNSSNEAGNNGSGSCVEPGLVREGADHPQRKRNIRFLVRDVMKEEETEPHLGISGSVETVEFQTKVKPNEAGPSTSRRKKKVNHLVKEPKVAEKTEPEPGSEIAGDLIKIESNPSVHQATEPVKEAGPTKRKRKVTILFREALQRENNVAPPLLIDGSQTGVDPTRHDNSGPSNKKPKKVIRRKPKTSSDKEVKKETPKLPSETVSVTASEVTQCERKEEIEVPKLVDLNVPETVPTDIGTSDKSSVPVPVPSEPNALTGGRRMSTRNRPPTVRALEAVANGFLGGPKQRSVSASPRRARKSGEASRRSRKVEEETVISTPSEIVRDQPLVVGPTGDIQPSVNALDHHMVKVD